MLQITNQSVLHKDAMVVDLCASDESETHLFISFLARKRGYKWSPWVALWLLLNSPHFHAVLGPFSLKPQIGKSFGTTLM